MWQKRCQISHTSSSFPVESNGFRVMDHITLVTTYINPYQASNRRNALLFILIHTNSFTEPIYTTQSPFTFNSWFTFINLRLLFKASILILMKHMLERESKTYTPSILKYSVLWLLKFVLKYSAFYRCQCLDLAKFIKKENHNLRSNTLVDINLWVHASFEDCLKIFEMHYIIWQREYILKNQKHLTISMV
jgi:hypothetical protein